jgi:subtilisin family serine protease
MPLKIANAFGAIYFSAIQNALYDAADNGADIASMSFGAEISNDPATDAAIQYAYDNGVTLFAATGNDNGSSILYPANHALVIAVGAASPCGGRKRSSSSLDELNPGVNPDPNNYTCDGERWWGSSYGSNIRDAAGAVDIIAPTILPTTDIGGADGYSVGDYFKWFNGTSTATPYAAGVAALILSANPEWTPSQIRQQIIDSATDVINVESGVGWDRYSGYGMINAAAAIGEIPLPSAEAYGKIIGGDQSHINEVNYSFGGLAGDVELYYEVWDVDTAAEVEIILNGTQIGYAPVTGNVSWGGMQVITLPDAFVNDSSTNYLTFNNTPNPPYQYYWGVRNVSVSVP